ncbi:atp-dependent dna helicase [Fusarium subglutinans]|uniref:Atp-dependent dna helicase n=1 Tax=Gibberella subglutinans TaxID=42677 RepID=A0A8H5QG79_GIBSU|nr:atp-dependent dna helicase [Fusarium subglutinans]KAF5614189.1 atp-dependent dna helicase [Fusarium subglutinans]
MLDTTKTLGFSKPHGDCDFRQHHPGDEREFNDFVERVFGILKDLPRQEKPYIELVFEMSSSGSRVTFTQKGMQYMELFDTWKDFPELPMISVFRACGSTDTPSFTPGDMCRLASKMPRLEKFGVRAIESIREYVYGDALVRNDLAKSLDLLPIAVQTLLIDYQRERIPDQTFEPLSIMAADSDADVLSEAVQRLTQRSGIREIILLASIDSAVFQPTKANPCWPTLESFTFAFCDVLPSGEWVVTGENPLSAEEEERQRQETREWATDGIYCPPGCEIENSFKSRMKEAVMDRFLVAAANAVCRMPKIKTLSVRHVFDPTDFEGDISRAGFSFSTAKGLMVLGKMDIPVLGSDVLEAWRTAAKTHDVVFDRCLTNELEVAGRYANEFGPEFQWDDQDVYLF